MSTALAERPKSLTVTEDEVALIRRTIAKDATPDELKLYLYDCVRQNVHPLDKLYLFTKRGGKYTPVTSIDFMRIRAGETGEHAGTDAALFAGKDGKWTELWLPDFPPVAAKVTVYRFVQGQRCKFEAVALWSEYKPDQDFMWRKMKTVMLGKCAEALALRRGFPKQLHGLYAQEEMEQAENRASRKSDVPKPEPPEVVGVVTVDGPTETTPSNDPPALPTEHKPWMVVDEETGEEKLAAGWYFVHDYEFNNGFHEAMVQNWDAQGGARKLSTKNPNSHGERLKEASDKQIPIAIELEFKNGKAYLKNVELWPDLPF